MKVSSSIGSDDPIVSTRLQDVGGNNKLSEKRFDGSTTAGIYKANNSSIIAASHRNTEKHQGSIIIRISESNPRIPLDVIVWKEEIILDDREVSSSSIIFMMVTFINQYNQNLYHYTTLSTPTFFCNKSQTPFACSGVSITLDS